jgi:hypothetical protein
LFFLSLPGDSIQEGNKIENKPVTFNYFIKRLLRQRVYLLP